MRKAETVLEIRRREKRQARRDNWNKISSERKKQRENDTKHRDDVRESAVIQLKKDSQQKKPDRRPGPRKFLEVFSFIRRTPCDKRHLIPSSYRCHSFNEERQYIDFFREFIFPYKISLIILRASLEKETVINERGKNKPSPDAWIIQMARSWVSGIASGQSFYKLNKEYFTRTESHFLQCSEIAYNNQNSVIELVFYAKCMTRKIDIKESRVVAKTFTLKFAKLWNHPVVTGFLDLLARNPDYRVKSGGLDDICDFILAEMEKHRKLKKRQPPFSFAKRTMTSVIALANEWHANILREQETLIAVDRARQTANQPAGKPVRIETSRWSGISVLSSRVEDEVCAWSFTQLCDARGLLNEGRIMKSCVSSYTLKCARGESAIFHVSRLFKDEQICEDVATLEVSAARVIVQAKGKCNKSLPSNAASVIRKWAQFNRIKYDLPA